MIMCRRATELMSQRLDRPLRWPERLSLRFHLSMCGACYQCNRQFELLHRSGEGFDPDRKVRDPASTQ
ncbi:zf-HC2 domain-containing protein [Billgrantia kenyensis]|uniref:Zf-HC2 domain-containing protein n=1 Tax=Billgrantia kenyensis TaxID=321266 RepID=A0A7V9VZL5_9GAMM|nr:zf-HC2 domain-containing protein [Halomonas kenyensis]MBA2778363.1 zf-HC2 domain-containing protein [Halomonas kenyensis]MCG6660669.1 zf-HC2 domain-containing protein [Halomonas kenyensis]